MIKEHTNVQLVCDLPDQDLREGDVGVVIHCHNHGEAYEVEFMTFAGETVAVCTLKAEFIQPLDQHTIPHARVLAV